MTLCGAPSDFPKRFPRTTLKVRRKHAACDPLIGVVLFLVATCVPCIAADEDAAFIQLWNRYLAKPEIQKLLSERDASNEPESIRVRLNRLLEGDLRDQDNSTRNSIGFLVGDFPVPDYSPTGGYGVNDIRGPWARPALIGAGGGATIGARIGMNRKDLLYSSKVVEAGESAYEIHEVLLHDAKQIQHNVRTIVWQLRILGELKQSIADGDKSEITRTWLKDSEQVILSAEQSLALQLGIDLTRVKNLLRDESH